MNSKEVRKRDMNDLQTWVHNWVQFMLDGVERKGPGGLVTHDGDSPYWTITDAVPAENTRDPVLQFKSLAEV